MRRSFVSGISRPFGLLSQTAGQVAHVLLTRLPLGHQALSPKGLRKITPLDLHSLGTPQAFVLSQDQTLRWKVDLQPPHALSQLSTGVEMLCANYGRGNSLEYARNHPNTVQFSRSVRNRRQTTGETTPSPSICPNV
jgi:hypothetical protein